jgi:peptidoglycan/LPS O-acetylase OafA/YrhL
MPRVYKAIASIVWFVVAGMLCILWPPTWGEPDFLIRCIPVVCCMGLAVLLVLWAIYHEKAQQGNSMDEAARTDIRRQA